MAIDIPAGMSDSISSLVWFIGLLTFACFAIDASFRRFGRLELHRKACHILGSVGACYVIMTWPIPYALTSAALLAIGMASVRKFGISAILNHAKGTDRGHGEAYFAAAAMLLLTISLFFPNFAGVKEVSAAILVTALADGLAPFGKHLWSRPLYGGKTFGGTLVCFGMATAIAFSFLGYGMAYAALFGLAVAATELVSGNGSDNLTVPGVSFVFAVMVKHFH